MYVFQVLSVVTDPHVDILGRMQMWTWLWNVALGFCTARGVGFLSLSLCAKRVCLLVYGVNVFVGFFLKQRLAKLVGSLSPLIWICLVIEALVWHSGKTIPTSLLLLPLKWSPHFVWDWFPCQWPGFFLEMRGRESRDFLQEMCVPLWHLLWLLSCA